MDPPSPQLVESLTSLGLVSRSDLARCRPLVRQFSQDLPTFDTVWVDALVRLGQLTPFQARQLYEAGPTALRAGEWILQDRLRRETHFELYVARHAGQGTKATLTRIPGSEHHLQGAQERLTNHLRSLRMTRGSGLQWPTDSFVVGDNWWVVSPLLQGQSLAEMLVRRGRFPADVVISLTRDIVQELSTASAGGWGLGSIGTDQFWIGNNGSLQVLHPGLWEVLEPGDIHYARRPLWSLNGMAPELLEPLRQACDPQAATVYAVGCICWELLVGRPPFPMADPLVKLSAHRTQQVPSLYEWAPEAPVWFQSLVAAMTAHNPQQRPNWAEVRAALTRGGTSGSGRVERFLQSRESAAARPILHTQVGPPARAPRRTKSVAAGLLGLGFLGAGLWWGPNIMQQAGGVIAPAVEATTQTDPNLPGDTVQTIPQPDASGVIQLAAGRYRLTETAVSGTLLIQGMGRLQTTLIIDTPCRLRCEKLDLRDVQIEFAGKSPESLLNVIAQELTLSNVNVTREAAAETSASTMPLIRWESEALHDVTAGKLFVRNADFLRCGDLLELGLPLSAARFENVLVTGPGSVLRLRAGVRPGPLVPLELIQSTFRSAGPLVRWSLLDHVGGRLSVQGNQTVLDIAADRSVLEYADWTITASWTETAEINATGLLLTGSAPLAAYRFADPEQTLRALDTKHLHVDGLLTGTVIYHGPDLAQPADSVVIAAEIPLQQSTELPGISDRSIR